MQNARGTNFYLTCKEIWANRQEQALSPTLPKQKALPEGRQGFLCEESGAPVLNNTPKPQGVRQEEVVYQALQNT